MPTKTRSAPHQLSPLWVISLFISFTETTLGIAATKTTGSVQWSLTMFVIVFPSVIAIVFFAILWKRAYVLYPPSEYANVDVQRYVDAFRDVPTLVSGSVSALTSSTSVLASDWRGNWITSGNSGTASINLPYLVNQASAFSESLGSASQDALGAARCGCLYQVSSDLGGTQLPADSLDLAGNEALAADPNCPICDLLPPPETQVNTEGSCKALGSGTQLFLILVGDPNKLGRAFALAAQQRANELQAAGGKIVACRISTIEQFNYAMNNNGMITGDVIYFGHSGQMLVNGQPATGVFVGEGTASNTNITARNVGLLSNAHLSVNTAIRLNGCMAALKLNDYYSGKMTSIANLIYGQLKRGVYAYTVGTYFSSRDAAHDRSKSGADKKAPNSLPVYLIPEGVPGDKPDPILVNSVD